MSKYKNETNEQHFQSRKEIEELKAIINDLICTNKAHEELNTILQKRLEEVSSTCDRVATEGNITRNQLICYKEETDKFMNEHYQYEVKIRDLGENITKLDNKTSYLETIIADNYNRMIGLVDKQVQERLLILTEKNKKVVVQATESIPKYDNLIASMQVELKPIKDPLNVTEKDIPQLNDIDDKS
jgi:hypothetical protein